MKPRVVQRPFGDKQPSATLYYGADCRDTMWNLPARSVHTVVTSPPYWGLRDYGTGELQIGLEETPEEFVEAMVDVFREVKRVLRDDGTLWLNLGDSYAGAGPSGASYQSETTKRRASQKQDGNFTVSKSLGERGLTYKDKKPVPPPGLKHKDLCGIPWRVALALQKDGWYLRSDIIWAKCLSGGAMVYAKTQKGEMPTTIKDLVRLDPQTVQLWNGDKWTQVVSFQETVRPKSALEIELRNGERIGCTPDHRWPTERGVLRADELQTGDVIKHTTLPEPTEVKIPGSLSDEDVGWFVGLYIAEGSKDPTYLHFASHKNEVDRFSKLEKMALAYDGTFCLWPAKEGEGATASVSGPVLRAIIEQYVSGRDAKTKHLHPRCWRRSNRFLEAVFRGYLSGDGHQDLSNDRWRLGFCKNDSLAQDFRALSARLGWSCRLKRCQHQMNGRKLPGWRGDLKIERGDHWNVKKDREIVAIRKSRARKFWDIEVADDPHLFALASGTLTHNSSCMPESVKDRPTRAHEYLFLLTKSPKYYYDHEAIKELSATADPRSPHGRGQESVGGRPARGARENGAKQSDPAKRNKRSVWRVNPVPYKGAHFAVFPPKLITPCVLAGTSEKGCCPMCGTPWDRTSEGWEASCGCPPHEPVPCQVLDPFSGSGTTGMVALDHGRDYVGLDLSEDYLDMAEARLLGEVPPSPTESANSGGLLDLLGVEDG